MRANTLLVLAAANLATSMPTGPIGSLLSGIVSGISGTLSKLVPGAPTVVVIAPGAWHSPAHYADLQTALAGLGYSSSAVTLASVGSTNPSVGVPDDAAAIAAEVKNQADAGKNVLVLAHSYAGVPASSAVSGQSVKDRSAAGKLGGVVGVLYMCAFVLPAQVSLADALQGVFPPWFNVTGSFMNPINPANIFYNDVTDQSKVAWAVSKLRSETVQIAFGKNTYEPWNNGIPVGYIHTTQDNALPSAMQTAMTAVFPSTSYSTTLLNTGHAPFLTSPQQVAASVQDFLGGKY